MKRYTLPLIFFLSIFYARTAMAQDIYFETAYFKLGINTSGSIVSLTDKRSGTNYFPQAEKSVLLSLYKDGVYTKPVSVQYSRSKGSLVIRYPNGSVATVKVAPKEDYLRFSLESLTPRNGTQAIVWGPYKTTISKLIGETVCVVRNDDFAIGLQALNINTIEGVPENGDDAGGGSFIDPLPGQTLPDSLKDKVGQRVEVNVNITGDMPEYVRMYRGSAAVKTSSGSELRLFSRDRRLPRVIHSAGRLQDVEPVEVDLAGSAIAFFGCPEPKTLDVIEKIELGEKLPHPMYKGVWIKRSTRPGEAYLMNELTEHGVDYAKACGFTHIHGGDIFETWGHFGLKTKRFPGGAKEIHAFTDKLRQEGITLGVHTLTMFTGTNDAYVSPVPSDSLCKAGSSPLDKDISDSDKIIYIKSPDYFKNPDRTHTVKIGKELINYEKVSDEAPWRLLGCIRGRFNTARSAHHAGAAVDKLVNSDYNGFYPDIKLQDQYAKRLAQVCNETGIDLMDFDGFGGGSPTGHGTYGDARFLDIWYRNLDRYRLTCGAGTSHYYWHIFSFMNWGEPWYNALRESQVNYRIENQRYFERNLMPGMLGWFSLNNNYRVEDIEWIQARSAAFNAGFLLGVGEDIEKNGFKDQLFAAVKEWQKARKGNAFSAGQKERMKNPKNEFHLEKTGDKSWNLYPVSYQRGFVHSFRHTQTGEPVVNRFTVNNPFAPQPVQLYISVDAAGNNTQETISNAVIEVNSYQSLAIGETLKAGDKIICDGNKVFLCDTHWKKLKELKTDDIPQWKENENTVSVKSDFSGEQSPVLKFDFKCIGPAEKVSAK